MYKGKGESKTIQHRCQCARVIQQRHQHNKTTRPQRTECKGKEDDDSKGEARAVGAGEGEGKGKGASEASKRARESAQRREGVRQ